MRMGLSRELSFAMIEIEMGTSGHAPGEPIRGRVLIEKNDKTAKMRSITVRLVQTDDSDHSDQSKFDVVDQVTIDSSHQDSIDFELRLPLLAAAGFIGHDSRAEWFLDASIDVFGLDPRAERKPITVLSRPSEPLSADDANVAVATAQRAASRAVRRYRWLPTFVALALLCVGVIPLVQFVRDYSEFDGGAWWVAIIIGMCSFWIGSGLLILRATYRKVGPTVSIDVGKLHVTMGETVHATVTVADTDTDLVARLQGVERFAVDHSAGRGVVVRDAEHVFHEQQCEVASGRNAISFVVPEHGLASYSGTATTIEWRVVVVPDGDPVREFTPSERIVVLAVL